MIFGQLEFRRGQVVQGIHGVTWKAHPSLLTNKEKQTNRENLVESKLMRKPQKIYQDLVRKVSHTHGPKDTCVA